MSYYQQQNRQRLSIGHDGNALTMLIAINLIVFVILAFIKVVYYISEPVEGANIFARNFFHWLTLPASFSQFLTKPWTLFSHMFVHDMSGGGIWHIVGNLIWLWVFGYILQDLTGNRHIFPLFLYGALAGALAYMIGFNVLPAFKPLVPISQYFGASAGIMAIAFATTTLSPNYRLFAMLHGGIPIWVITGIYIVLDLALIPDDNPGGRIAHIAGAVVGFTYMKAVMKGKEPGGWMHRFYDWVNDLFNPDKPAKGKVVKTQLFYKAGVEPFKRKSMLTQQKVDEILEKIHQKGYQSLTEDEREVLKRASKEDI